MAAAAADASTNSLGHVMEVVGAVIPKHLHGSVEIDRFWAIAPASSPRTRGADDRRNAHGCIGLITINPQWVHRDRETCSRLGSGTTELGTPFPPAQPSLGKSPPGSVPSCMPA